MISKMLKVFCLVQSGSIVLTLLTANIALSQLADWNSDTRNCYLRKLDGTVVHVDIPCGQASPVPVVIDVDRDKGVDITSPKYQKDMETLNKQQQMQPAEAFPARAWQRGATRQKRH